MPILYFGGSFNPIHRGHLAVAQAVALARSFDRVKLIVSADPPHKSRQTGSSDLASAKHRIAMARLAAASDPLFEVDDLELHRAGPSYTFDTVRELRRRDEIPTTSPVFWLIGADAVSQLPTWHRAEELIQDVEFVVVARPGFTFNWAALPPAFRKLENEVVEAPLLDISATDIRRRVRAGQSIEGMVEPPVQDYIVENSLYR